MFLYAFPDAPGGGGTLGPLVIGLLALVWAVLLLPSVVRSRVESSPMDGVRKFERTMGVLENTRKPRPAASGRWIMVPRQPAAQGRRRNRIISRRRQTFLRMVAVAGGTL